MARPRNQPDDVVDDELEPDDEPEPAAGGEGHVYRLRLVDGIGVASFMTATRAIELDDENPYFETADRWEYLGARDLPFLEEV